jgi:hypothetical protein
MPRPNPGNKTNQTSPCEFSEGLPQNSTAEIRERVARLTGRLLAIHWLKQDKLSAQVPEATDLPEKK